MIRPRSVFDVKPGRDWRAKLRYCDSGHRLDGDNLIVQVRKDGAVKRQCRACHNARQREYYKRRTGQRTVRSEQF